MGTHAPLRRRPAARIVLLMLALFVTGGAYAALAPAPRVAADSVDPVKVRAGQDLYDQNCSSCHGLGGVGSKNAPTLVGVGAAAVDFYMGTGRMPATAVQGQIQRGATKFTGEQIDQIASYVATLGEGNAVPDPGKYDSTGLTEEEIARGGELFRTNCSACHNFSGQGGALPHGLVAPTLVGVDDKYIYEAMRIGPQQMPIFANSSITDKDALEIIGYLDRLYAEPSQGGLTFGGIGPVAEGLWAWILGVGVLALFAVWIAARGSRAT